MSDAEVEVKSYSTVVVRQGWRAGIRSVDSSGEVSLTRDA